MDTLASVVCNLGDQLRRPAPWARLVNSEAKIGLVTIAKFLVIVPPADSLNPVYSSRQKKNPETLKLTFPDTAGA